MNEELVKKMANPYNETKLSQIWKDNEEREASKKPNF